MLTTDAGVSPRTTWLASLAAAAALAVGLAAGSGEASADDGPSADSTASDAPPAVSSASASDADAPASGIAAIRNADKPDQLVNATKQLQETQMSFNLQYLQLQSQMQHENRSYTAVSNIMKTKHDTVKNSIGNIR
jgi:hypothetical protein